MLNNDARVCRNVWGWRMPHETGYDASRSLESDKRSLTSAQFECFGTERSIAFSLVLNVPAILPSRCEISGALRRNPSHPWPFHRCSCLYLQPLYDFDSMMMINRIRNDKSRWLVMWWIK